jgi:hypothetical protein
MIWVNSMRTITSIYQDPLEVIWIAAAESLGMHVVRDPDVFASWDGAGTLRIGEASTLDADDSLAQMIFHEICHAAVEGPAGFTLPDWGLDITDPAQLPHEKACLRLQAALADRHGLRTMLAATTDFRRYYDNLTQDPLEGSSPAVLLARAGWERVAEGPWGPVIEAALKNTALLARIVGPIAPPNSLWIQ